MAIPVGQSDPQGSRIAELLDLLRERPLDDDVQTFIGERMLGSPDNYAPPDYGEPYEDGSNDPYQVAGDVVPMRTHPPSMSDVNMRLKSPGVGARSQGMQTIERFGNDPRTIDLLGVLNMMTGKEPGR